MLPTYDGWSQSVRIALLGDKVRIIKKIEIEKQEVTALFDTGALHTYIVKNFLKDVPIQKILEPYKVALGGRRIEVNEHCLVNGKIEGLGFSTYAIPIDELGKVNGNTINVIIGALTMEEWEIIPNPKDGTLNLEGLKRREFTEFIELV